MSKYKSTKNKMVPISKEHSKAFLEIITGVIKAHNGVFALNHFFEEMLKEKDEEFAKEKAALENKLKELESENLKLWHRVFATEKLCRDCIDLLDNLTNDGDGK